jgi:hypothetical protein
MKASAEKENVREETPILISGTFTKTIRLTTLIIASSINFK